MLRSIWLLFLYVSFLGLSTAAPFVATLGYVWVDTFTPQNVAYIVLNQLPVAMIMGVTALAGYLLLDRRSPPPLLAESMLMVAMTIWVNATMVWAVSPEGAWEKWDWAAKTLAFSTFIPLVIRSRVQIEAFAQTYVFSLAANFVPFGLKVMISGGGYGQNLGLSSNGANTGLGEGGLLSTACLMAVPLALHLARHSQLIPRMRFLPVPYWIVAGLAVITAIGTYERSALIGIVILVAYMWVRSRHKIAFGVLALVVGLLITYTTSSAWNARVSTIADYAQENSALTRLLVWRWTLQFSETHPLGGGFQSYQVNHIEFPAADGLPPVVQFGRAFHSIYFEMLGEQGFPGVGMLLLLVAITLYRLRGVAREARTYADMEWVSSLSDALQSGIVVFLACGAFVGIMFQPMFWYFIAMSISLNAYMWRARRQEVKPAAGWREKAALATGFAPDQPSVPAWRTASAGPGVTPATPPR